MKHTGLFFIHFKIKVKLVRNLSIASDLISSFEQIAIVSAEKVLFSDARAVVLNGTQN